MDALQKIIEESYHHRADISPTNASPEVKDAIYTAIDLLDQGIARVAEKKGDQWHVNEWLKKAVLLYFRIQPNQIIESGDLQFYDKVPLKHEEYVAADFTRDSVRVVPGAIVRKGSFIAANTVLMPSFVNIGAYVDSGVMVDTWATVGSCAQIGKNVHLSGGVGIGGVLEPLQAKPTIIEDNVFIGARSEIVEGVIVEANSVISMGVFIGQSTRIYNRETGEIFYGRVPSGSVVVPGSLPSADGRYSLACAIIVKRVDEKTRGKVSINELLRGND